MCGFTCRESEDECSSDEMSQSVNQEEDSDTTHYAVLKPVEDGLEIEGTFLSEISELIVGQFTDCLEVAVNSVSKELLVVDEMSVSGIEHEQVLNLNDDGERWEGDVLDDCPFGWGVLYDSENRRVYEGFRIGDVNVCYGKYYYSDIQKVEYEGEICEGKRWGRGVQYDRNGDIVIDGEWIADAELKTSITISEESTFLHSLIEELTVSDNSCNGEEWKVLEFGLMPYLRDLHIGNYCFRGVSIVTLYHAHNLERVVIGSHCFSTMDEIVMNPEMMNSHDHLFVLNECYNVRELLIGDASFREYGVCRIESDPSLEKIEFGTIEFKNSAFLFSTLLLRGMLFQSVMRC